MLRKVVYEGYNIMTIKTRFTEQTGAELPIIGGAMYPCSNPELVRAVSDNGGIGMIQPLTATYVYGWDFRKAIQYVHESNKPYGLNVLLEYAKKEHETQMMAWLDIALEEGCKFYETALGKPTAVIEKIHSSGGIVYHKCTNLAHAKVALNAGADGLILVNNRAGGHAGNKSSDELQAACASAGVPLIMGGGISTGADFANALKRGYDGVLLGTRLIATTECKAHNDYKQAILNASEADIVLTQKVTGIPLSVIRTAFVESVGTEISALEKFLFRYPRAARFLRAWYHRRAQIAFKRTALGGMSTKDYYQAGKGVGSIKHIQSVQDVFSEYAAAHSNTL
jgi:nitronate monooxygenase